MSTQTGVKMEEASKMGEVVEHKNPTKTMALFKVGQVKINNVIRKAITAKVDVKAVKDIYDKITPEQILDLSNSVSSVTGDEVRAIVGSLFDFMGFDPEIVMRVLLAINKYYQSLTLEPPETSDTLKEDIIVAVGCTIRMGNLQFAASQRRSDEAKAVIGYLISKYGILVGSTGAGMASTVLTFPRIANSFPVLTVRSAVVLGVQNNQQNELGSNVLPIFMRVAAFVSLLDADLDDRTGEFIMRASCAFSCDYQRTVHEGNLLKHKLKKADNVFTIEDAWNSQYPYYTAIRNSKVPGIKMKRAMLTELKVSSDYDAISQVNKKITELMQDKFVTPSKEEFEADLVSFISGKVKKSISEGKKPATEPASES